MRIRGTEMLTPAQLVAELEAGSRFVHFEYCISFLFVTLWRPSDVYLLRGGERGLLRSLRYTLLTLLLGWWGLPWGIVYTPLAVLANLAGGRDVTRQVRVLLEAHALSDALDVPSE